MAGNIKVRISLVGSEELKKAFDQFGDAGKKAFADIEKAAKSADVGGKAAKNIKEAQFAISDAGAAANVAGASVFRLSNLFVGFGVIAAGAAVSGVVALQKIGRAAVDSGVDLDKASKKAGTTAQEYQSLSLAAVRAGVDQSALGEALNSVQKALREFQGANLFQNLARGTADLGVSVRNAGNDFGRLGGFVSNGVRSLTEGSVRVRTFGADVKDLNKDVGEFGQIMQLLGAAFDPVTGKLNSTNQAFGKLLDALAKMGETPQRQALGFKLFGDAFIELEPLLKKGSAGFAEAEAILKKYGLALTDAEIAQAKLAKTSFNELTDSLGRLRDVIGIEFAPLLTRRANQLTEFIRENATTIKGWARSLAESNTAFENWVDRIGKATTELRTRLQNDVSTGLTSFFDDLNKTVEESVNKIADTIQRITTNPGDLQSLGDPGGFGLEAVADQSERTFNEVQRQAEEAIAETQRFLRVMSDGLTEPLQDLSDRAREALGRPLAEQAEKTFTDVRLSGEAAIAETQRFLRVMSDGLPLQDLSDRAREALGGTRRSLSDLAAEGGESLRALNKALNDVAASAEKVGKVTKEIPILNGVQRDIPADQLDGVATKFAEIGTEGADAAQDIGQATSALNLFSESVDNFRTSTNVEDRRGGGPFQGLIDQATNTMEQVKEIIDQGVVGVVQSIEFLFGEVSPFYGLLKQAQSTFADIITASADFVIAVRAVIEPLADGFRGTFESLPTIVQSAMLAVEASVAAMVASVSAQLDALQARIDAINAAAASAGSGSDTDGSFATGGLLRGPGTGTSDSMIIRASSGEFVVSAKAVRKFGARFFAMLNAGRMPKNVKVPAFKMGGPVDVSGMFKIPKFATGGLIGGALSVALPSLAAASSPSQMAAPSRAVTVVIDGNSFGPMIAPENVAGALVDYATRTKLRRAGAKPSWER